MCVNIYIFFICTSSPSEYQPITHWNISTSHWSPCFNIWGFLRPVQRKGSKISPFLDFSVQTQLINTSPHTAPKQQLKLHKTTSPEECCDPGNPVIPKLTQPETSPTFTPSPRFPKGPRPRAWPAVIPKGKTTANISFGALIAWQAPAIRSFHWEYLARRRSEPTRSGAERSGAALPRTLPGFCCSQPRHLNGIKTLLSTTIAASPSLRAHSGTPQCRHNANKAELLWKGD